MIPAGAQVADPSGLLGGGFRQVLTLISAADLIVVDTPAAGLFAEATAIAAQCDATIVVIDATNTHRRALTRLVENLRRVNANPVGIVLNRVDPDRGRPTTTTAWSRGPRPRVLSGTSRKSSWRLGGQERRPRRPRPRRTARCAPSSCVLAGDAPDSPSHPRDLRDAPLVQVAIVHERFTEVGGSERVVEQLHELWPSATVHAAVVDPTAVPEGMRGADVRPTKLQRLYRGGPGYAHLLPFLPAAMRGIDFSGADVVVTSHHAFANRVRPPAGVPVVSYTHTPARWMWEPAMLADEIGGRVARLGLRAFARAQRPADRAAAQRLAAVVANSSHVAARVQRWWGRTATVVHPPVAVDFHTPDPSVAREDFFLVAGRLVPYKRPEVAVAAARAAGVRLVVAGDGRARPAVEAAAGPATEILGSVDDLTLRDLFRRCRALVFPGEEDFGIVPVEAQACGAPVIALAGRRRARLGRRRRDRIALPGPRWAGASTLCVRPHALQNRPNQGKRRTLRTRPIS